MKWITHFYKYIFNKNKILAGMKIKTSFKQITLYWTEIYEYQILNDSFGFVSQHILSSQVHTHTHRL